MAHCANQQNSFSIAHQVLFKSEESLPSRESFVYEANIPNADEFESCMENRSTNYLVERDEIIADSLHIRGVPYLIINGKGFLGSMSYAQLETIIRGELK
ncbi:MAG: hypothetical protein FH748_12980 [Balneolaceae bacterium]|nr:hypothetical protein [Balneolaceae bacterium]